MKRKMSWKIKKSSLIIFIILIFPFYVLADNPSCTITLAKDNSNTLSINDTVNINLGLDSKPNNMDIYELEYNILYDNSIFSIVGKNNHFIEVINGWEIVSEEITNSSLKIKVKASNESNRITSSSTISTNSIATLKFKVIDTSKSSSNIIIDSSSLYKGYIDSTSNDYNCSKQILTIYLKSNINTLSSIKINNNPIENFSENINNYNLSYNDETINIEAIRKDNKSKVSGDIGTKTLSYGTNTFTINVVSESGKKNVYTLNITRIDPRSSINTLKTLKLSSGNINFKSNINDYEVTLKNEIDEITITTSLTDPKSNYVEDFSKKTIYLNEGMNKISISVMAENGNINTYNISITRELSSNNTLESLRINDEEIKLVKNTFLYNYKVNNNITKVDIDAIPSRYDAKIDIENTDLEVGENEINIYVTAANGDVVSYTIIVTRENLLSNNNLLKRLTIKNYDIAFNSDTKYYTLKIGDEDTLEIEAIPEDDKSIVTIDGNKNLINGSIIKINVKAEDNSLTRYFITIEKGDNNTLIWIIIITILIIILIIILIFIIKRKNKGKEELIKKEEERKETYYDDENTTIIPLKKNNVLIDTVESKDI